MWIKVKYAKVFICGFYRSGNYCPVDTFLEYMTECMKKLRGKKVVWIGDVNIDQNNFSSASYRKLDMVLKSFNMVQTVQGYTRIAKRGDKITNTTVDVCFTNCYSDFQNCSVLVECPGDHQVIKCMLDFKVKPADKFMKISIRDHSSKNIDRLCTHLQNCSFADVMNCDNTEEAANNCNDLVNNAYDNFCPHKSIRKHPCHLNKPSKQLLKEIRLKRKLYRKFKRLHEKGSASSMAGWETLKKTT